MLPAPYRMRNAEDFKHTVRRGVRVARPTLVVHASRPADNAATRVGFVVSKGVGGAVHRNRVKRRLRHLVADRLAATPDRINVVVRALPTADTEPQRLAGDLASAWSAALARLDRP